MNFVIRRRRGGRTASAEETAMKKLMGSILQFIYPTNQLKVSVYILILLVFGEWFTDVLNRSPLHQKRFLRFTILPIITYTKTTFYSTLLINVFTMCHMGQYPSPTYLPTLFSKMKKTWMHIASVMFFMSIFHTLSTLSITILNTISDSYIPTWLWWADAVLKPAALLVNVYLIYMKVLWLFSLVILVMTHYVEQMATGDHVGWNLAVPVTEKIMEGKHLQMLVYGFVFSGGEMICRVILNGSGFIRIVPILIRYVSSAVWTAVAVNTGVYSCVSWMISYGEKVIDSLVVQESEDGGINQNPNVM